MGVTIGPRIIKSGRKAIVEKLSKRIDDLRSSLGKLVDESGLVADDREGKTQFRDILADINSLASGLAEVGDNSKSTTKRETTKDDIAAAKKKLPPLPEHDRDKAKATLPKAANPDVIKQIQAEIARLVPDPNMRELAVAALIQEHYH